MTLDEAVTYFTEEAELRKRMSQLDGSFVTEARNKQAKRIHAEAAKNNKQLAEWLMELKELRAENINLKNDNERLRDCVDSCVLNGELDYAEFTEAKRLLKAAVEDFSNMYDHIFDCDGMCYTCPLHGERDNCLVWRYADEAENLLNDEK